MQLDQKRGWAFTTAVSLVKPTLLALTKREWHDGLKIPAEGGCVVAMNHLSHADPLTYAHFIYDHGRIVRYLAKQEVFEMPFVKTIAVNAGQIPVARLSGDASKSFDAAVEAVREGRARRVLPGRDDHPRPRPVADARQDRRRTRRARAPAVR